MWSFWRCYLKQIPVGYAVSDVSLVSRFPTSPPTLLHSRCRARVGRVRVEARAEAAGTDMRAARRHLNLRQATPPSTTLFSQHRQHCCRRIILVRTTLSSLSTIPFTCPNRASLLALLLHTRKHISHLSASTASLLPALCSEPHSSSLVDKAPDCASILTSAAMPDTLQPRSKRRRPPTRSRPPGELQTAVRCQSLMEAV